MNPRYLVVILVMLTATLAYIGPRYYSKKRHAMLTAQLKQALSNGDRARAVQMLHLGADANAKDNEGDALIFSALDYSDTSVLKALIMAGADVNARRHSSNSGKIITPISMVGGWSESLFSGQIEQIKLLLEAGADPNLPTDSILTNCGGGCTEACWCNPCEIELLIKHGTKLRKDDAEAILEAAIAGDDNKGEGGSQLLRLWAKLPVPIQERRQLLKQHITKLSSYSVASVPEDEKHRLQNLNFLKRELRLMDKNA